MQKFLNYFITICVIIIGAISAIQFFYGGQTTLSGNYLEDVSSIAQKTGVVMNDIVPYFGQDTKATPEEILNHVVQAKKELMALNEKAKNIQPPESLGALHNQFKASLDNYVASFNLTEEGLKNNDNAKLDQAGDLLFKGADQMKGVSEELTQLAREQK